MSFKETYFHSTISYAKEYSLKQLIAEEKKILNEFKEKEQFLKDFDINPKKILKNYEKVYALFSDLEIFFKKNIKIKKITESSFFKKREKVDLIVSKDFLTQLDKKFKITFSNLYEAFKNNKKIITRGLYTKITYDFYKLKPTGDYYNVRKLLNAEEEQKSTPKIIQKNQLSAMGAEENTSRMFKIIPPGIGMFSVSDIGNNDGTFFADGVQYKYEDCFTIRAMNILNKIKKIINDRTFENNTYDGPYCYMAIPRKIFYETMFKEENEIRKKQLRQIELYKRLKLKSSKKEENTGYVYVLKSVGYPGLYKIGSTYGLAEERAEELSGTNVPDPWTVVSKIKIQNAEYFEKLTHKYFSKFRYRKNREFFKIDISEIKKCLKNILSISEKGKRKIDLKKLIKNT